jgi:hypothetical protein
MIPRKQMFAYTREESDLPPQVPNHLLRTSKNGQIKKNVRIRSLDDHPKQRRSSIGTSHSNQTLTKDDEHASQLNTNRTHYGPIDIVHRPLWNYQNRQHRQYVPNSRRDPNYVKRHRQKQDEHDRIDHVSTTTIYNRWNSDSELQKQTQQQAKVKHSMSSSAVNRSHRTKDEPRTIVSQRSTNADAFAIGQIDHQAGFTNISSFDKYEHYIPYTRTDEILDPARAYSPVPQSRGTSDDKQRREVEEILIDVLIVD